MASIEEAKQLICDVCLVFYGHGWVSGTGGGMSIKVGDSIVMAPSGVQKERMVPSDMFVLDGYGKVLEAPKARPAPHKPPKLSECSPLFMAAYELRGANAVLHSHSMNAMLASVLDPKATEFRVTELEMIKGIAGHGYYETCVVPIIENTARECELTDRLRAAMQAYPKSQAVLVRRHGVYVWGSTWVQAKTQAESYDYLFEAAVRLRQMGINAAARSHAGQPPRAKRLKVAHGMPPIRLAAIVLDIEGTIAPISFVAEKLFPYAVQHLEQHLESTWDSEETQQDLQLLRKQAEEDITAGLHVTPILETGERAHIMAAAIKNVREQMKHDRKTSALKSLQGHIWRQGFASGELVGEVYPDVPGALTEWRSAGIKLYIYSSGSRQAQQDLLGHSSAGVLQPDLSGFFDTSMGAKVEASSYRNILLSLPVSGPEEVLFVTDNIKEAEAARDAGWQVAVAVRPGNAKLPAGHTFREVRSLEGLLS